MLMGLCMYNVEWYIFLNSAHPNSLVGRECHHGEVL